MCLCEKIKGKLLRLLTNEIKWGKNLLYWSQWKQYIWPNQINARVRHLHSKGNRGLERRKEIKKVLQEVILTSVTEVLSKIFLYNSKKTKPNLHFLTVTLFVSLVFFCLFICFLTLVSLPFFIFFVFNFRMLHKFYFCKIS